MKCASVLAIFGLAIMASSSGQEFRPVHQAKRPRTEGKDWIPVLQDPKRDAYQKPAEVIEALKLKRGEVIADLGAGSGYFSFRLATGVGKSGRVYAVDISPELIIHLNRRIRELGMENVFAHLAVPDDPLLADDSIDRFFICNTWHHISNRDRYLGLMKRMLKPGGQVVMVDFKKEKTPVGPPLEERISREQLVQDMERNGFRLMAEHDFLPHQYFMVFKPQ